jgi:hypothetical protein
MRSQLQGYNKHTDVLNAKDEFELFRILLDEKRDDFIELVYLIFPFGQKGHALENYKPREWQLKEWAAMTEHLKNPLTKFNPYRLVISTGNGSGKTAFTAITMICLLYTYKLRGRVTANTKPQLQQIVWPEYDKWLKWARYSGFWFEKLGESIRSKDEELGEQWRFDMFTWDKDNPAAVSGLHNQGHAILYVFEEAPGIPAVIFQYARGAFAATNTVKFWIVLGNSDNPDSKFEQLMNDMEWRSLRIDTRTMKEVDKAFIAMILKDCNGDEDHDDFRVRVRGLPRKTNVDSIINRDKVRAAFERRKDFNIETVNDFPCILTCDPAWQGGDMTVIWYHQGNYSKLLAAYKLRKQYNEDHKLTYDLLCYYEKLLKADAVLIDQGEGTAIKTYANQDEKYHWELIAFGSNPNDVLDAKESEYANMRAQMYYMAQKEFNADLLVLDISEEIKLENDQDVWERVVKHFGLTTGDREKKTHKKLCISKKQIKLDFGESPDFSDGFVLKYSRRILDRREENVPAGGDADIYGGVMTRNAPGSRAIILPESQPSYNQSDNIPSYQRRR